LNIDRATSERLRLEILGGNETNKPGWVRVNFSYLMQDETAQFIINSISELANNWENLAPASASAA